MAQRSEEPNISGYALANGTSLNTFEFLAQNPVRARGFAAAMSGTSQASFDALATHFDWQSLPEESTVVDVGGANGHVSCHLARKFEHLRFVVQDMLEVAEGAQEKIPEELRGRVAVVGHDMFTEQTVKDADVYLLRYVLHDWPDKYCIKVLRNLVPALKRGARIVIQDHLLPEPGSLSLSQEMHLRYDLILYCDFDSHANKPGLWMPLCCRCSTRGRGEMMTGNRFSNERMPDIAPSRLRASREAHLESSRRNGREATSCGSSFFRAVWMETFLCVRLESSGPELGSNLRANYGLSW
jgi:hypothetical protein